MSSPDRIDERFDALVRDLRACRPVAGDGLRERVHAIVEREPEPSGFSRPLRVPAVPWRARRRWLVLVPVASAVAAAAAGIVASGSGGKKAAQGKLAPASPPGLLDTSRAAPRPARPPAPSGSRLQLYAVAIELGVGDVSSVTKRALVLTRSLGGYVRSVRYGSERASGSASLVLRVPTGKVQRAVVEFASLGRILGQHVSIEDVQPQVDARYRALQGLRVQAASLRAKLAAAGLTDARRAALELRLARAQAHLAELRQVQQQSISRARFATVSLGLEPHRRAVVVPPAPGRIGRALHQIGQVLVRELEILLYVVLVGAPFAVLAALVLAGRRSYRRRAERQLIAP